MMCIEDYAIGQLIDSRPQLLNTGSNNSYIFPSNLNRMGITLSGFPVTDNLTQLQAMDPGNGWVTIGSVQPIYHTSADTTTGWNQYTWWVTQFGRLVTGQLQVIIAANKAFVAVEHIADPELMAYLQQVKQEIRRGYPSGRRNYQPYPSQGDGGHHGPVPPNSPPSKAVGIPGT
jgi:hypothetical protein